MSIAQTGFGSGVTSATRTCFGVLGFPAGNYCNDVHIVPVGGEIIGLVVEFPTNRERSRGTRKAGGGEAAGTQLWEVTVVRTWSDYVLALKGPAPIIGHLQGFNNVLLATGHYRNGVLPHRQRLKQFVRLLCLMNFDLDFKSHRKSACQSAEHKIKVGSLEWFHRESLPRQTT